MPEKKCAIAKDFQAIPVYSPEVSPRYAGWASLFDFGDGNLGCAVNEIRRAENPDFRPMSLEWAEAMVVPYQFGAADADADPHLVSEYVCLKSSDGGRTWRVTGRSLVHTRHYWHVGFPGGRMIRIYGTSFMDWPGEDRCKVVVEESTDGGTEWRRISRFLDGYSMNMLKVKRLRDGSVVMAGPIRQAFGPGKAKDTRITDVPFQVYPHDPAFFISPDGGRSWGGPHYVFPGILAWEFDFVELPDGSLLFINSQIQSGPAARQIVRRTKTGFVNEPMMWISRGATKNPLRWDESCVPETVCITPDGLLVGALRNRPYACSNDLGENWYEIAGLPNSNYQPMMIALDDGRFLNAWHTGSDHHFGEIDMVTGIHVFRIETHLPAPTKLTLARAKRPDGDQFVNVYEARLTSGGNGVPDRRVELRVSPNWTPEGRQNPVNVRESPDVRTTVTDENGITRFDLRDIDAHPDAHFSYWLAARFVPAEDDDYAPCMGPKRMAYAVTPVRNRPVARLTYVIHGVIMVVPEAAERFPELFDLVNACDPEQREIPIDLWTKKVPDSKRLRGILDFLVEQRLASRDDAGVLRWYCYRRIEGKVLRGIRLCTLEEHYV
ncbi:MAG: sialidase family protein [Planctomycetota bacterium]